MPGITQRKHVSEMMRIRKQMKRPLYNVAAVLPAEYNGSIFLELFKEFYPHEWNTIEGLCKQAKDKDAFLKKVGKKERYKTHSAEKFFMETPVVKNILNLNYKQKHKKSYDESMRKKKYDSLKKRRVSKITATQQRISKNTELMQVVEPYYVDALISAYHQRDITIEGKMEIVVEMRRYICDKTIKFFYKINDAEKNNQIRNIAFQHLQKSGHYVKLRKGFKGKKKEYMTERTNYIMTPDDLRKRLTSNTIQSKKRYGAFISHSYKDANIVKNVIAILNKKGISCYCDWSSDNDFLKRALVSEYTKEVLKSRIEQSDYLFFIRSSNSMSGDKINSPWVEMELRHGESLNKKIIYIDLLNDGVLLPYKLLRHNLNDGIIDWSGTDE